PPAIALGMLGYAMIVVGIAIAGPGLLFGSYGDLKLAEAHGNSSTAWFNVGLLTVPAASMALLSCYRKGRTWIPSVLALAMVPVLMLLVLIGDRGGLAAQMMALGWIFTQRYRKLPLWVAVAGFTTALILMPIMKEWRNYRDLQLTNQLSARELVAATFYETGSSGMIVAFTVDAVPRIRGYDYGIGIALPFAYLVPWIGTAIPRLNDLSAVHNPNFWISEHIDPASYDVKGANHGFTMTGTWYTSFGTPGVFVLGTLIGWVACRFRNMARGSPIAATASGLFVVFMFLFIRNSLGTPLRFAVWPFMILVAGYHVLPYIVRLRPEMPAVEQTSDPT
ncbi:MAG TPA: O-antigen polysaccharide polymerase Wzy, partial [Terrimesophilobacter sp.]|nr:O-antigen polysaccharide polymerase Wzy [Terrimesophilobacter sp.]